MEWTRSIVVDRPLPQVQEAVADEHRLVEWSAWPDATGYRSAIDGDGRSLGSAIDFRATAPLPPGVRQLVERLMGGRIRRLHDEDLERLKAHVEQAPARRD